MENDAPIKNGKRSSSNLNRVHCQRVHFVSSMNSIPQRFMLSACNSKASFSQSFVRAEVVEKTTKYQAQIAAANMTLLVNDVELSIPQGTPAPYIAELIGALS